MKISELENLSLNQYLIRQNEYIDLGDYTDEKILELAAHFEIQACLSSTDIARNARIKIANTLLKNAIARK